MGSCARNSANNTSSDVMDLGECPRYGKEEVGMVASLVMLGC